MPTLSLWGFLAPLALSLIMFLLPAMSAPVGNSNSQQIALHFPEHSMGQLYSVRWVESLSEWVAGPKIGDARGDVQIPPATRVRLRLDYTASESLKRLMAVGPALVSVDAHRLAQFDDGCLRLMLGAKSLQQLNLDDDDITDQGLEYIALLPSIVDLKLNRTEVTGAGLRVLKKIPNLTRLSLISTRTDDASMTSLLPLQRLQYLSLGKCHLSDKGVETISALKSLKYLSLGGNHQITNKSISSLKKLKLLEHLELAGTGVNIESIQELKSLPRLHFLTIQMTDAELVRARKMMPNCDIKSSPELRVPVEFWAPLK